MNEQTARELMMDALYEEISDKDKKELSQYLQSHSELQKELEELQTVRSVLQKAPDVKTHKQLFPVTAERRTFSEWWSQAGELLPRPKWAKTLVVAAACLLLFFIGVAAANLNIHSTEQGLSLHLGYGKAIGRVQQAVAQDQPKQVVLTPKQVQKIVRKVRENNVKILTQYAQALTKSNRQQLQQVVDYFKQKRANNLKLFQTALNHYKTELNQYQQKTNYTILQTHQVMGQMAKAIVASNQH